MALVKVDGVREFESRTPADMGPPAPVQLAQGDSYDEDTLSQNGVAHPKHDEVVVVPDLAGQTIDLGFNPNSAEFMQVNGDLIAVLPNGGVVILEGFNSALQSDSAPTLFYRGKPLALGVITTSSDAGFGLAPAGEAYAPTQLLMRGGASTYTDDLGFGISRTEFGGVGSKPKPVTFGIGQDSGARIGSVGAYAPTEQGNGYGKGGKNGKKAFSDDVNHAPTDLDLSSTSVPPGGSSGSPIGMVSVSDPDIGDRFTFTLLDDAGGCFAIDGVTGALTVANGALLDYQVAASHDITVRVTDSGGKSYDEIFTLLLQPPAIDGGGNEAPTAIALDAQSVEEAAAGAIVGHLTVSDPNAEDSHSFTVNDERFEIVDGQLKLKDGLSLDHETADQVLLTVIATDQGGLATSQDFAIAVLDVNEPPTDILLGTDVDENAANGTLVKIAVAVDPDEGDTFTFKLLDDASGRFAIDSETGAVTVANGAALDYEAAASHDITIEVTDSGGETYQESFTIHINDVNEAPTDLDLTNSPVQENSAPGSVVGTVNVSDPDQGDVFTFQLLDDAGGRFAIDRASGVIRVVNGSLLDFETNASHSVTVRATDRVGSMVDESFTITVQDIYEGANTPPTAIALDNLSVEENAAGAVIGQLSVSDSDVGDGHGFTVDDTRFEVVGGALKLKDGISLNHETGDQIPLTVTATDRGGLSISQGFAITVLDVNEAPTDILLGTDINENAANGTLVEVAVAIDSDHGDTFIYQLVDDAGGRFAIDSETGAVTVANGAALDYEADPSHSITIRVTDSGGKFFEKTFIVDVNDVNERPTDLGLNGASVLENSIDGTVVGMVNVSDPDAGDSWTFQLLDNAGGRFAIDSGSGQVTVANGSLLDYEAANSHAITVRATDSGGESYGKTLNIAVTDVSETPGGASAPTVPAFYVSPLGKDSWSGLLSAPNADGTDGPFATLARARDAMRADPDIDTTYVREGTYQLASTLQLTSQDKGVSFMAYAGETPVISGGQAGLGKLFRLDDADGVNIIGLTFRDAVKDTHLDGFALDLRNVDGATIGYNTFINVNVGVELSVSNNNTIVGNEMNHINFIGVEMWGVEGNSVVGNYIHDIGALFAPVGASGVQGYSLKNNTIAHNLIENSAGLGISIMDGGSNVNSGNIIEYNQIYNTSTMNNDSGAIYMLGRSGNDTDTIIRYNHIEQANADNKMASGIYLDDLTSGVEVYGNFIKDTGMAAFHLHGGRNITITNNVVILLDEPVYAPLYGGNTAPVGHQLEGHELFVWLQIDQQRLMSNIEWSGNVISAPDGLTPDDYYWRRSGGDLAGQPKVTDNLLHNVDGYDGLATGTPEAGSVFADPLFTDPAAGDYSLQANSPAFGLGFEPLPFAEMGLSGFEILDVAAQNEMLALYLGYFPVFGTEGSDALVGTNGDDLLQGHGGNDVISGGIGDDVLYGGGGNDTLDGGPGNNLIRGGLGADTIDVSQGHDLVVYDNLLEGGDIIKGFDAAGNDHDIISLDRLFDGLFVATADRAERISVQVSGDTQVLRVDSTGDGSFDHLVATVTVMDGGILGVGLDTEDVQYGTL
jgi:Cadherin domain/Right handed beta helix region/RTX calcium-binding nonapeptide repeat (4 copies)